MNSKEYIESGVLELYVMGMLEPEECTEVEQMIAIYPEVRDEVEQITKALKAYAEEDAGAPHATIKPLLMATIDYSERLQAGEQPAFPPVLNENSKIEDYAEWLNREDMLMPGEFSDIYAKIIGYTPQMTTAIVWISSMSPQEVHDDEYEKFLIVEGTCDLVIGNKVHQLVPGDYLAIPLHIGHEVKVTSSVPCKVILQRIAA
ncbi:MAG: hypothetical protein JWO44_976 [Bacteroidetes bacterium]|jgi:mannose-6-phosphate isomerase-like protein (cupin superfamily)|nr:hypothetical protein [Bacteroidota bacterium]